MDFSLRLLADYCSCGRRKDTKKNGVTDTLSTRKFAVNLRERHAGKYAQFHEDLSQLSEKRRACTECTATAVLNVYRTP